jgi:hypothetical protein
VRYRRVRNQRRIAPGENKAFSRAASTTMHHAMHDHLAAGKKRNDLSDVILDTVNQVYPNTGSRRKAAAHTHPFDRGLDHAIGRAQARSKGDNPPWVDFN